MDARTPACTRSAPRAHRPAVSAAAIEVAGAALLADLSGALLWPDERVVVVADLHLEKGSACAARGQLVPPFDTAVTLKALARLVARENPRTIVTLGDSFHDGDGAARLSAEDRETLASLQRGRDFLWIAGNHDPEPDVSLGGTVAEEIFLGPLVFRHRPGGACPPGTGEIAGHLHPSACVVQRGRGVTRRCFATDGTRLVMPAFGAFTGGLNVRHPAFRPVFAGLAFRVHLIGDSRLYTFPAARCVG